VFLGILRPVISSYTSKIDLIITDMEMLRLNGADLCARLLEERPEIKALVMSGADTREIVSQNVDLPVPPRPFDGKTLIARVRALLSPATVLTPRFFIIFLRRPVDRLQAEVERNCDVLAGFALGQRWVHPTARPALLRNRTRIF